MLIHRNRYKQPGTLIEFLKTSLPAVVDLSSQPLVWAYEAILIGQISFAALGSVAFAFHLVVVSLTAVLTFVVGSSLIINRHLGRGDSWQANHIFGQSMMLGIVMSVVIGIIWYTASPVLFKLIKESEPAGQLFGVQYLQTLALFSPIIIVTFIALGIIRGTGDTHFSLIINMVMIGINVLLAPLLVFGQLGFPRMEVVGLALAKGIAYSVGLVITAVLVRSRKCCLFLPMREMTTPQWESVKLLFRTGFPATVEQLSWAMGQFIVSGYAARLGIVVLTTHQIFLLLQSVMSMVYQGFGLGSMTLIGKKVSADEHSHAEYTGQIASRVILITVLVIVGLITVYPSSILRPFTDNQGVMNLGLSVIFIFALVQIPKALNAVLIGTLRGAGELKWLMWVTVGGVLFYEISASWVMVFIFHFALAGIWIVHGFDEASRFLMNFFRFKNGKWKPRKL